ncbi:MAG TPA: hypothetical protein VJZ00_05925 [Thermoanaerobaculia bacterium]|nr:hypothetical protein [Thermoanaerobaculia bacterium]
MHLLAILLFATFTERDLMAAAKPLYDRQHALEALRETAPERYVTETLAWSEELAKVGQTFRAVSQSQGILGDAETRMRKTADFVRRIQRDPKRAIAIYRRAAELHDLQYPNFPKGLASLLQIADTQEYDLNDHAAAAATLRPFLQYAQGGSLAAELAYLEHGKTFTGPLTKEDLPICGQSLYFGFGADETAGEGLAPDLNPFADAVPLAPATRAKLLALPPSHSMFMRTWIFAARLEDPNDARTWLERNDKAGWWRACVLTLSAIGDKNSKVDGVPAMLARTPSGKPSGFALLARRTTNTIPKD